MTHNQIAYWQNQESIRSNKANEQLRSEEARIKDLELKTKQKEAEIKSKQQQEVERHNLIDEALNREKYEESQRQFVGNFVLGWGRNLAGAASSIFK